MRISRWLLNLLNWWTLRSPATPTAGWHRETDRDAQWQSLDVRLPNGWEEGESHLWIPVPHFFRNLTNQLKWFLLSALIYIMRHLAQCTYTLPYRRLAMQVGLTAVDNMRQIRGGNFCWHSFLQYKNQPWSTGTACYTCKNTPSPQGVLMARCAPQKKPC